jgi:transposase
VSVPSRGSPGVRASVPTACSLTAAMTTTSTAGPCARGVKAVIARRGTDHGSGLGRQRWVVERTFAHLHNLRRLRTRYERSDQCHYAFMLLGCAVVCQRFLAT